MTHVVRNRQVIARDKFFFLGPCNICPSIYDFWLPLWYLRFTTSDYPFGILDLRLLITTLVSSIYDFWLPLWHLRFTTSDYHFGIFQLVLHFHKHVYWDYILLSVKTIIRGYSQFDFNRLHSSCLSYRRFIKLICTTMNAVCY
jgi:hypothetical protein